MTEASDLPRVDPFGDAAVLVVLGDRIDPDLNRRVHTLAASFRELAARDPRFGSPVPAYASVLVPVDPLDPGAERAAALVRRHLADEAAIRQTDGEPEETRRLVEVPTRYGGADGPDLDDVATLHGLEPAAVVELHASVEYRVYMLGFAPGFAYLGRLADEIATPRRETPRTVVPAGSVGIAGVQTGIYPFESPGGWQLIGRTEIRMWDTGRNPPALLAPGDRVRFVPLR